MGPWDIFAWVGASLSKGMRVVAQGRLRQRTYQDREGNQRTAIELEVDEIGPSLRYATAQVTRAARTDGQGGSSAPAAQTEQWATESPADGGWSDVDSTPF